MEGPEKPEAANSPGAEPASDVKPATEELAALSSAKEEERVIRAAAISAITWYRELGRSIEHLIETDIKRAITIVDRTGRIIPPLTKLIALQGSAIGWSRARSIVRSAFATDPAP